MDINQMRYFLEICNTQSISKAAENVFLTQQGLSSSMRRLEAECGCNLFFRKGGKLILTDAGSRFKADAEAIIKKIDQ
ncbi:MAG: LysR family transcriptional regulator, partial [Candidatus Scatomorpha sp.]